MFVLRSHSFLTFIAEERLQRFALATLYYATNGHNWDDNKKWLSDENECEWDSDAVSATFTCSEGIYQVRLSSES